MIEEKSFAQRWEEHQQRWDEFQPSKSLWLWSCVGSALLPVFIGFIAGGWMTSDAAEKMATQARAELVANVCAETFAKGQDFEARLSQLQAAGEPRPSSTLQEGGSVMLAGMDERLAVVASLCADKLANTKKPSMDGLISTDDSNG